MTERLNDKLVTLASIFIFSIVASNVTASKLINFGPFVVPIAVFCYPITFAITDIVSEVYGKRIAQKFVWAGFLVSILLVLYLQIVVTYPPASFFEYNEAFVRVFSSTARIVLASMIAYIVSQTHDVWAFHVWKKLTKGRHLWARNNFSTMVSQFIDTCLFITIAFLNVVPGSVLLRMIFSQYVLKFIIALIDTPFVYLGVKLVSGKWTVTETN